MRTVVLDTATDALVVKETVDLPEPGADEVLLRVLACGVSPVTLKTAKLYKGGPQLAAGFEVVGEVERIGSHVTELQAGDQVRSFPREVFASFALAITITSSQFLLCAVVA